MTIFQYESEIEILINENEELTVWGLQMDINQISPHRPAYISGPPENCHPEEAAEWEVTAISLTREDKVIRIEDSVFLAFFGQANYDRYMDLAYEEACESDEYR